VFFDGYRSSSLEINTLIFELLDWNIPIKNFENSLGGE